VIVAVSADIVMDGVAEVAPPVISSLGSHGSSHKSARSLFVTGSAQIERAGRLTPLRDASVPPVITRQCILPGGASDLQLQPDAFGEVRVVR
jgi:hypothetical protein